MPEDVHPVPPGGAAPTVATLLASEDSAEPVRYTGVLQPDPDYYDGRLPHAVGVHHVQVFRGTRVAPGGHSYNHQPYLVWWRGRFHLQFLSAPRHEHEAPTVTQWCSSADGYTWSAPQVAFPEYGLPAFAMDGVAHPAGLRAVMHQRMGFYVAPNTRLLMLGFYGICPDVEHSPNAGNGVGRVVREIRDDGTLGEIYFIRYNRHAGFDERNTSFPFYTAAPEPEFRHACEQLLADKLATLQWWEEDRASDGFFAFDPGAVADAPAFGAHRVTSAGAGKAFTWFTRPDGVVVGLWKNQYAALSPDRGRTWTPIARNRTLRTTGAKTWGQRTSDGRFVLVYNHSATQANRFPISALVGDDGRDFPTLMCLGGEVPPRRYWGHHKGPGMHYFRGISEGSTQSPDGALWIAYSVNKEDIWVLRAQVPLTTVAAHAPAADEIGAAASLVGLTAWNFHLPQWATSRMVKDPGTGRRVLELRDEDPWDYARAERVFPASTHPVIRLLVQMRELPPGERFELEVQDQQHARPVRLRLGDGALELGEGTAPVRLTPRRWTVLEIEPDCGTATYAVRIDGLTVAHELPFAERSAQLERMVFRTGPWRGAVPLDWVDGTRAREERLEHDDVASDDRVPPVVIWIASLTVAAR